MVIASVTMGLMFVVLILMVLSAFNFDNLLSVVNLGGKGEQVSEAPAPEQVTEEPALDSEVVRQLLGFVDYPVVKVRPTVISVFSPEAREVIGSLGETEIQQRCAYISIAFNRDRCVRAERACAESVTSDQDHWACLNSHDYWVGKELSYLERTAQ
jgi:hypothetical protein